ncbi:AMP-binding enzyme family protein (macronuclear) [Tetrahymena thermophila SB210]|uniref:AMP-binding enzyme family protein n=1 Tax=Tetrahymena thermophila (strain SB210) TaxID=312017 RepID=W7XEH4_TETTS|nr:AMP-binding enzyme family protein [Tetrahymena thermophila SB210]EWS75058.1 AMP-binding enzyme family protein [Tetrahymena thermophila SB210]|eukprot:XP_012652408.1 AMP-binding enzyme family protein [Tetrahymena thermophila SB210]
MELNNDLVGFRFEYDSNLSIDLLQAQNNKTYLVYVAQFFQANQQNQVTFNLDVIDCSNPSLIGFKCLDFSKISNYTFSLDTQNNLQTQINIFTYGCLDLDQFKTFIPDNCASQAEIDNVINGINGVLRLKHFISQFNITSQQTQVNYRNAYVYTMANQSILSRIKTQKQVTSVKRGLIIQSQTSFSSPIEYDQQDYNSDRNYALQNVGYSAYSNVMLYPDELVQQIQIEFTTLPQVFAQVNSIFTLLMLIGVIGRAISKSSIKRDFFMIFLKNLYQTNYLLMQGIKKTQQKSQFEKQFQGQKQSTLTLEQQQQLQKEEYVEVNQDLAGSESSRQEEQGTKVQDEKSCSKSIPLFYYRPSILTNKQYQNISLENQEIEQKSLNNSPNKFRNELVQQNKIGKTLIEEDSPYIKNDSLIQYSNLCNKQTQNIISESIFINQSQNSKLKTAQKDEQTQFSFVKNQQETKNCQENQQQQKQQQYDIQLNQQQNLSSQSSKRKEEINECVKKLKAIQDKKTSAKIKKEIFKFILCKKRQKSEDIYSLTRKQKIRIDNQINQDLNILNFIKDMIFIKKAVFLLLRKDQLAALNLIGFSPSSLESDLRNIDFNLNKKKLSYYEMQQAILQSEKLQERQLEKFLKRCQNNQNANEVDNRILQSLQQNQIL